MRGGGDLGHRGARGLPGGALCAALEWLTQVACKPFKIILSKLYDLIALDDLLSPRMCRDELHPQISLVTCGLQEVREGRELHV